MVLYQNHHHLVWVAFMHCNANWQGTPHISSHCVADIQSESWQKSPSYAINLKASQSGIYLSQALIYWSKRVIKGKNVPACVPSPLFISCFLTVWYVRKVCSVLSISKYWYNTPFHFRLGFVNDEALLNQQPLNSKQNCLLSHAKCSQIGLNEKQSLTGGKETPSSSPIVDL